VSDKRRATVEDAAPWFVLTGDTLFVGSAGRPDLAGKETVMAGQIHDSLHHRLMTLAPEVELYPGHTSGSACGAGMSGKPVSTIGFEKHWNPMLAMDRDAFIAALTESIPPRPAEMDRIVAFNLGA
jgi:glyoxylase-like metal-dependent hydrolase (beta-lactamase superfamily II)